jgi:hypothetical protein
MESLNPISQSFDSISHRRYRSSEPSCYLISIGSRNYETHKEVFFES